MNPMTGDLARMRMNEYLGEAARDARVNAARARREKKDSPVELTTSAHTGRLRAAWLMASATLHAWF